MIRTMALGDVVAVLAERRGDAIVVTGPSALSGALYATDPDAPVLYNMELAYATACAFGIAMSVGQRPVIAIEGDGSAIAGLGGLATIARYRPANLTIVLVDNGVWGTGDNTIATPTALGADLAAAAVALGWPVEAVHRATDAAGLAAALEALDRPTEGPTLIVVSVDPTSYPPSTGRARPQVTVVESAVLLQRHLRQRASAG